MRFANPLGLLGLLAVPVLIIIYIIKSKFTEQTITSTYLWTLSERFLKRKNPINKITGIISLLLQILAVVLISWALAHPVFTLPGKALDYCFILDGSGSMQTVQGGSSRFEDGKERIRGIIEDAADGSTFTLITTGNTTEMVMKEVDDKKTALRRLDGVEPAYVESNLSAAAEMATKYLAEKPACKFYLVTDRKVENVQNAEVINVSGGTVNYALEDVSFTYDGATVAVRGKAFSYENDAQLTVDVFVDGAGRAAASTQVSVSRGEGGDFYVQFAQSQQDGKGAFDSLRVAIRQSDNLPLDNQIILYNAFSGEKSKALIVSNQPAFIKYTLSAAGVSYDTVAADDFDYGKVKGRYGLYIFQNCTPESMPEEGAVWFINPDTGVDETSGFSRGGAEKLRNPTPLTLNPSSKNRVEALLKYTDKNESTFISEYLRIGTFRDFTTLVYCDGVPVIMAGNNSYGNREVVFGIDLIETSDFAMSYNGRIILYNLIQYTFPSLVGQTKMYTGEALSVNVPANCTSIKVGTPSGKEEYISTSSAITDYELTEVGEYKVTAVVGGNSQVAKVYAQLSVAERKINATEPMFYVNGVTSNERRDGRYEDLLYAFIILAVIVVADWAVYCYEQYQLR